MVNPMNRVALRSLAELFWARTTSQYPVPSVANNLQYPSHYIILNIPLVKRKVKQPWPMTCTCATILNDTNKIITQHHLWGGV
jgi:hypothetical protein